MAHNLAHGFCVGLRAPERAAPSRKKIGAGPTWRHVPATLLLIVLMGAMVSCSDFSLRGPDETMPPYETYEETFTQTPIAAQDILWLIDSTKSMEPEGNALASLFNEFIEAIEDYDISYQVGIITTDADTDLGQLQGTPKIITPELPAADQIFSQNVLGVIQNPSSKSREEGFRALTLALDPEALEAGAANFGFLRESAGLSIIVVSDSNDNSPESVDYYYDWLVSIKGGSSPEQIMFSAIVGEEDGCYGPNNVKATDGERYIEMTDLLNGVFKSICSPDFSSVVAAVGKHQVALKSHFPLRYEPIVETITVFVNEVQANAGEVWDYSPEEQSLVFRTESLPEYEATIRVIYQYLPSS